MNNSSVYQKVLHEWRAFFAYRELKKIQDQNREYVIFVAVQKLGDICYHFAFLNAIKNNTGKKILVMTTPYAKELVSFYPEIDKIIYIEKRKVKGFTSLNFSRYIRKAFNNENVRNNLYTCNHWAYYPFRIMHLSGVNYFDILRSINYEIEKDVRLTYPTVPECDLSKYGIMDWNKIIIINPYSNFLNTDMSLFLSISNLLIDKGYIVFTNTSSVYNKILPNTRPLSCNLQELYYITKYAKLFVSVRTGLLDFTISNCGRYLVIYDYDGIGLFKKAYCLNDWGTQSDVVEYESNQAEEIMSFIDSI